MSIATDMLQPALDMIRAQGQAVTLRRKTAGSVAADDGSISLTTSDYTGYAVFDSTARSMAQLDGSSSRREIAGSREVCYLAAQGFSVTPIVGDVLYRASSASGTPQRVEAVDAVMPGSSAVLFRLELAR